MREIRFFIVFLVITVLICSCQRPSEELRQINPKEIEAHIRFLSDDLLEGRLVDDEGLEIAALYQENFFRGLGLEPCFNGSFRQPFELRAGKSDREASLEIISPGERIKYSLYEDFVVKSQREDSPELVEGEIVYCGYLVQAPERDWDDIKGADLKGKVLLVEVNEPGNYPDGIFDGEDMTYYGRWRYKFEKASELGAAGILVIHNTKGATYGWGVVRNSRSGEFFLADKKNNLYFQGWMQGEAADRALRVAGYDREELLARAETKEFEPVFLGLKAKVRQKPVFRSVIAENVAGIVRGRAGEGEERYIILSAHYDHLGRDATKEGDQIYNGAVDNCSASACMLSLARYYTQQSKRLDASLVFLAVSAEEEGLLGSEYFVRHLPFPKSSVLANLNFEMTTVWGETEDVYAIGGKHSDLDDYCRQAAENIGLKYIPERLGELGYFFRSDQLSFVRGGIPGVWLHEGITSRGEDKDYILRKNEEYRKNKYHKVIDEIEEDWDFMGTVQICLWAQEIIALLSEAEELPQFKPSSSFSR